MSGLTERRPWRGQVPLPDHLVKERGRIRHGERRGGARRFPPASSNKLSTVRAY